MQLRTWSHTLAGGRAAGAGMAQYHLGVEDVVIYLEFDLFAHVTSFLERRVVFLGRWKVHGIKEGFKLLERHGNHNVVRTVLKAGRIRGAMVIRDVDTGEVFDKLVRQMDVSWIADRLVDEDVDLSNLFDQLAWIKRCGINSTIIINTIMLLLTRHVSKDNRRTCLCVENDETVSWKLARAQALVSSFPVLRRQTLADQQRWLLRTDADEKLVPVPLCCEYGDYPSIGPGVIRTPSRRLSSRANEIVAYECAPMTPRPAEEKNWLRQ